MCLCSEPGRIVWEKVTVKKFTRVGERFHGRDVLLIDARFWTGIDCDGNSAGSCLLASVRAARAAVLRWITRVKL